MTYTYLQVALKATHTAIRNAAHFITCQKDKSQIVPPSWQVLISRIRNLHTGLIGMLRQPHCFAVLTPLLLM